MQRIEHNDIIQLMQALGYTADKNGVCCGVAMMGLQACTIEDIDSFNKRLDFIKQTPDLAAKIAAVKVKLATQSLEAVAPKRLTLTDEEQKIIDVIAFLESVEIHQNPQEYARYFEKPLSQCDGAAIAKIAASQSLETSGGLHKLKCWPGIYNDKELKQYFVILQKIANHTMQSFSIILSNCNHTIALHYNAAKGTFYVIDANSLPIKLLPIGMTLAQWVKRALMAWSDAIAFETCVYTSGNAIEHAKQLITAIDNEKYFANLHTITAIKASYTDCNKNNLAYIAAYHGHVDVILALHSAGANLNTAMPDGATPAFIAAYHGHVDVILALHSAGENLNAARLDGVTSAFVAAQEGHVDVIQALYVAGANLNTAKLDGATPAFIAAQNGYVDVILVLHKAGANLNIAKLDGATPAFIAAENGHVDVICALHAFGANLDAARLDGATPAFIAAQNGYVDVILVLHKAGANLDAARLDGATPAFSAAKNGHVNVILVLHAAGVNLNVVIPDGAIPAFIAAQNGHADVICALHAFGANLDAARLDGATPAYIAAQKGHADVLQVLWGAGVDLTLSTPFGTPLAVARRQGHQACITFLENVDKSVNSKRPGFFAVSPKTKPKIDTTNLKQTTFTGMQHAAH